MDAIEYTSGVKTFKDSEVISTLLQVEVAVSDLEANISRIVNNDIDLSREADQWIITKGLQKFLRSQGLTSKELPQTTLVAISAIQTLIPAVQLLIKSYKEKIWDGKLMTLKQVNILNLIEHLTFWVKYTRMIFDVLLTMQTNGTVPERYLSKYDLRWVNGTEQFYRQLTAELLKGSRAVIQRLAEVPDIEVTSTSLDVLEGVDGKDKIDLLKQGFGIHLVNPLFWYGLAWQKIDLMRIEQMRRDNELFAMKISQASNLKGGNQDPQLEHRIEIYQNEIIKNAAAIEAIEKQYA